MSERRIHYRRPGGGYLCGVGNRWASQTITSSRAADKVTCLPCQRALAVYPEARDGR